MKKSVLCLLCAQLSFLAPAANLTEAGPLAEVIAEIDEIGKLLASKQVPVETESLKTETINALIKSIDPGAAILTAPEVQRIREEELGVLSGVGLQLRIKDDLPEVIEVMDGGPAALSGLAEGDLIEYIGDKSARGMKLEEVVNLLRGPKGEAVELKIRGADEASPSRAVSVVRDIVKMPEPGIMEEWPQGIGYIKLKGVYESSGEQVASRLELWADKKYCGCILDLRDSRGGDLDSVVRVAELFARSGEELFSVHNGADEPPMDYRAIEGKQMTMPLMVLINKGTSGAAETLAATLKNRRGILLIGTPSNGDDRIREGVPLADGRVLYIATKRVHLAERPSYRDTGVEPDVLVAETVSTEPIDKQGAGTEEMDPFSMLSEDEKAARALIARVEADPALRRAADILLGVRALGVQVK